MVRQERTPAVQACRHKLRWMKCAELSQIRRITVRSEESVAFDSGGATQRKASALIAAADRNQNEPPALQGHSSSAPERAWRCFRLVETCTPGQSQHSCSEGVSCTWAAFGVEQHVLSTGQSASGMQCTSEHDAPRLAFSGRCRRQANRMAWIKIRAVGIIDPRNRRGFPCACH